MNYNEWRRKLANYCKELGFVMGETTSGHLELRHVFSDQKVYASSTPGDRRTEANTLSKMERIAGKRLPRDSAAKYKSVPKVDSFIDAEDDKRLRIARSNIQSKIIDNDFDLDRLLESGTVSRSVAKQVRSKLIHRKNLVIEAQTLGLEIDQYVPPNER